MKPLPLLATPAATSTRLDPAATPALDLRAIVGAASWARLPAAVQRRFATGHAGAVYVGHMSLHCSALGRALAWLVRPLNSPLRPERCDNLPTRVEVCSDGRGGVVWTRWLGDKALRSTKSANPEGGLWERTEGGLTMALDVFEEDGALVFQSRRYEWQRAGLRLRLPTWLSPGRCRVEHRDLGQGRFRFSLEMNHPLWGCTFKQTGVFTDPADAPI
jgi:Domain of unknown function (DUF4166)